jgi:DsbC/DsbD-like thiol-disulfide interchange protein
MIKVIAFFACLSAGAQPLWAQTSQRSDNLDASLRQGWQTADGAHMAGLQLILSPGWKTYWRSPGEAGIPPLFNWTGSDNVQSVRIHWPRPTVFHTNGLQSIGYHDQVILPLEIMPINPAKPVHLQARVDLGVCKDICLPASVSLSTDLAGPGVPDAAIAQALDDQPVPAAKADLRSVVCDIVPIADGVTITATLRLPLYGTSETVAFETAQPDVWVAQATTSRRGDTLTSYTDFVPPSGAPFVLDRSRIRLTVISETRAFEIAGCPAP